MKYIDNSTYKYNKTYPIVRLSDIYLDQKDEGVLLEKIKDSPWYIYSSDLIKKNSFLKLKQIISLTKDIELILKTYYPNINIKHLSIGGSYLFKNGESNDIDFNVIVEGSFFDYMDVFEFDEINKKLFSKVKKVSFMIFGEDDLLFDTNIDDTIETTNYIHTSLCMREGVVFSIRNIIVQGFDICKKEIDTHNLIIRIKRQLYHARLLIEGRVNIHTTQEERLAKAVSRICEATFYLSLVFPELKIDPKLVFERETMLITEGNMIGTCNWLKEVEIIADNIIVKVLNNGYHDPVSPYRLT